MKNVFSGSSSMFELHSAESDRIQLFLFVFRLLASMYIFLALTENLIFKCGS